MNADLTLLVLRLGLLALLWIFVFIVIYSVRSDMFGPKIPRSVRVAAEAHRSESNASASSSATAAVDNDSPPLRRIVITAGPKAGTSLDLPEAGLTIGRSSGAGLQVSDDYTSTNHARLSKQGDAWVVEDLGSTNGTFLAGKRVTQPTPIVAGKTIRIGTTQFELRP